eukprot:TRINITY_DN1762_c1_g1_i1.p1 TRINITY_DN1762_c1_g1~~TRINITY_DN1762_c1_g1_i1.p1  ORF type:complete len:703 (+),score=87.75 TRINITY_DN1762_c1_g1_i1:234-2342(+)
MTEIACLSDTRLPLFPGNFMRQTEGGGNCSPFVKTQKTPQLRFRASVPLLSRKRQSSSSHSCATASSQRNSQRESLEPAAEKWTVVPFQCTYNNDDLHIYETRDRSTSISVANVGAHRAQLDDFAERDAFSSSEGAGLLVGQGKGSNDLSDVTSSRNFCAAEAHMEPSTSHEACPPCFEEEDKYYSEQTDEQHDALRRISSREHRSHLEPSFPSVSNVEAVEIPPGAKKLGSTVATWLLNIVAVGYAGTAVAVKFMEGGGTAGSGQGAPASVEFFVRFLTGTIAVGAIYLFLRRKREDTIVAAAASSSEGVLEVHATEAELWSGGQSNPVVRAVAEAPEAPVVWPGIELGIWMFITYAGQAVGLETSTADEATFLLMLSVVLVPFLEAMGGRTITSRVWLATLLACTGMALLEGGGSAWDASAATMDSADALAHQLLPVLHVPAGHLWCLLGAVGSAVHVVRSETRCVRSDPLGLVVVQLATVAALAAPWAAWDMWQATGGGVEGHPVVSLALLLGHSPWGLILLAGPIGTGLCEWLELEALRFVKASTATLVLTAVPLWSGLFAFVFLGETMDASSSMGALFILAASLSAQLFAPPTHGDIDSKILIATSSLSSSPSSSSPLLPPPSAPSAPLTLGVPWRNPSFPAKTLASWPTALIPNPLIRQFRRFQGILPFGYLPFLCSPFARLAPQKLFGARRQRQK